MSSNLTQTFSELFSEDVLDRAKTAFDLIGAVPIHALIFIASWSSFVEFKTSFGLVDHAFPWKKYRKRTESHQSYED